MTPEARWALVRGLDGLICRAANRYSGGDPERAEDLAGEIRLYLYEHAGRYDPARGAATTWAHWAIRGALRCAVRRCGPASAETPRSDSQVRRSPRLQALIRAAREPVALDAPLPGLGEATLADLLPGPDADLDSAIDARALARRLPEIALTAQERDMLHRGYGLDGEALTSSELREHFGGVSRARVGQVHRAALSRIRDALGVTL